MGRRQRRRELEGSMMPPCCRCLLDLSGRKYKTVCELPGLTKRREQDEALRITDAWVRITARTCGHDGGAREEYSCDRSLYVCTRFLKNK